MANVYPFMYLMSLYQQYLKSTLTWCFSIPYVFLGLNSLFKHYLELFYFIPVVSYWLSTQQWEIYQNDKTACRWSIILKKNSKHSLGSDAFYCSLYIPNNRAILILSIPCYNILCVMSSVASCLTLQTNEYFVRFKPYTLICQCKLIGRFFLHWMF